VSPAPLRLVRLLNNEAPSQCLSSTVYAITDQQMIPSGFPWNERRKVVESCVNGGLVANRE
jgi:hypothetical protein